MPNVPLVLELSHLYDWVNKSWSNYSSYWLP